MFSGEDCRSFETKVTALPALISASPTTPASRVEPAKIAARPNRERLVATIEQLASIGAKPDGSVCRRGFSPEDVQGRELLAHWMKQLANDYLSDEAIDAAGLLSKAGVRALFARHEDPATTDAERVQMDAVINHLLGVQMLHRMFVAEDVPALARREADRLGWRVLMPV